MRSLIWISDAKIVQGGIEALIVLFSQSNYVPSYRRGKDDQKEFTVFVCSMLAKDKTTFEPVLNHEHFKWRWFPIDKVTKRSDLHPIVRKTFSSANKKQILAFLEL